MCVHVHACVCMYVLYVAVTGRKRYNYSGLIRFVSLECFIEITLCPFVND